MTEIIPVAWTVQDQIDKVAMGDIGFISRREKIEPAADVPLYSKATVDALHCALRYVVRVWVVDDDAYDPDAELERAVARFLAHGANA